MDVDTSKFDAESMAKMPGVKCIESHSKLVEDAKKERQIPKDIDTKEAVRMISVFLHGLSANMAAGMRVKKARALLHDQLDLVLLPHTKFKSS